MENTNQNVPTGHCNNHKSALSESRKKKVLTSAAAAILLLVMAFVFFRAVNYKTVGVEDVLFSSGYYPQYNSKGIIKKIFTTSVYFDKVKYLYRPVFILSFYIDSRISSGEVNLKVNHITSIVLHMLCVLMFFYFLQKYCFGLLTSLIASLFFAVNVFSVWSAVWLSGRCDLLLFLFGFASFICFIKANENKSKAYIFWVMHFVFLCIALLSKETAVVVPVVCVVYGFIKQYSRVKSVYIVYLAVYALYFMIYSSGSNITESIAFSLSRQNIFYITADYFSAALLLSKPEIVPVFSVPVMIKGLLVIAVMFVLALRLKEKKEALFFLFFAVIFLGPTLFGIRYAFQGNRMYVPVAGIIVCCAYIITGFLENIADNVKRKVVVSVIVLLLFFNMARAVNMINYAYDDNSFFSAIFNEQEINRVPNPSTKLAIDKLFRFCVRHYEMYGYDQEAQDLRNIFNKNRPRKKKAAAAKPAVKQEDGAAVSPL